MPALKRLILFAPYILALASLSLIVGLGLILTWYVDLGADWSPSTGLIDQLDPGTPASRVLQLGDRVLAVDGLPITQAPLYPTQRPGGIVEVLVERGRDIHLIQVSSVPLSPLAFLIRIEPMLIALAFWLLSIFVIAFNPRTSQGYLFFLLCQASGLALTLGTLWTIGIPWAARVFELLFWWLGAISIHFHLHFPRSLPVKQRQRLMVFIYAATILLSCLDLLIDPLALRLDWSWLYMGRRLWLGACLLVVVLLLVQSYRVESSGESRRRVRLIALGSALGLIPFLGLSLLPDALFDQPLLPYELSLLYLLAIPLSYGYAIAAYRFIRLDRPLSRGAAYALVITLLASLYLVANAALIRFIPPSLWQQPVANLVIVTLLAVIFGPLLRRLQFIVNRLFYGGWYDYRSAVQHISQKLNQATDSASLAQTLSAEMQKAMHLECACLLLPESNECMASVDRACANCTIHKSKELALDWEWLTKQFSQSTTNILEPGILRQAWTRSTSSTKAAYPLVCSRARLSIMLGERARCIGLLILGAKRDGEPFDTNDLDIINMAIHQASIALQNARLVAELEQRAREREGMYRLALVAREEERRYLARELHDQIIQALIGLNYHLSELRTQPLLEIYQRIPGMQQELRELLSDTRTICKDLRPPALDHLGLIPAIRVRLEELENQSSLELNLTVEGDDQWDIPEVISISLYRFLQEALLNVQKHACAQRVHIKLCIFPDTISLSVQDDGRGFIIPQYLGELAERGHFGLVGLRERLELIHGTFRISSAPEGGTIVEAQVPLPVCGALEA